MEKVVDNGNFVLPLKKNHFNSYENSILTLIINENSDFKINIFFLNFFYNNIYNSFVEFKNYIWFEKNMDSVEIRYLTVDYRVLFLYLFTFEQ